ncbi:hypothetical protein [Limnohabitans sp. Rim28]|jgi:hypothetical protein|uniref:hypothetical protein n=1 Tax=Limnohabitans sp. Rim28 TaxID=1100720 RepID=UPI00036D3F82|nr:hypothetical protein [Limnohabitans sp. Rim28]PVE05424.1 hypothetical protein B472_15175 [Limnohabitans sp. Rim28]
MKRDFSPQDNRTERRFGEHRGGSCIALIDGRFLMWLAQQGATGATGESVNRQGLLNLLSIALSQSGLDVDLRRIYWYSDRPDGLVLDDQIVRLVQTHDADGGASLIRSLGHDLKQLAQQHACDHVLVASDDERFLALIDDAQLGGLSVHILADESARNMPQMVRTDPGWARLLAQADRRVVVNSQVLADMLQGKLPVGMGLTVEDVEELRQSMHEVITAWWADEPEDLREDLRDALQVSRGIPQEVDRQLLLRMRQRLTRALSLPEKKMLRETLRAVVAEPAPHATPALVGLPPDTDD